MSGYKNKKKQTPHKNSPILLCCFSLTKSATMKSLPFYDKNIASAYTCRNNKLNDSYLNKVCINVVATIWVFPRI